jgi:alpha-1,2-mannosyltransferase
MCGMCAVAETYFIKNIYERFGKRIATFSTIFLLFSNGMFNAAPSYVPSTFAMICLLIAFGSWFSISMDKEEEKFKYIVCIATAGTAVLLGWPFCIVCIIPLALDCIFSFGFFKSLKTAIIVTVSLLGAIAYVDYIFYKRVFFTPVHLVLYNKGSGSEKYGVEPWNFFFKNLTLAFNIAFWLALICPIVIYLHSKIVKKSVGYIRHFRWVVYILPFQIWFWFFTVIKHKEERFLFVVYPTICLAAAITLELIAQIVDFLFLGNKFAQISKGDSSKGVIYPKRSFFSYILVGLALFVFTLLGISRTAAVFTNYHAPFIIYGNLYNDLIREGKSNESINICVGKEWYRFPSSFFLPSENVKLQFIRSEFRGLLPKPFEKVNATSVIPTDMNSDNREEMSRYIDPKDCDYLVDFDFEDQKEEHYVRDSKNWEIIYKIPFLDVSRSPPLTRSFYIPKYSAQNNVYGDYCLLKSRRK